MEYKKTQSGVMVEDEASISARADLRRERSDFLPKKKYSWKFEAYSE